MHLLNLLPMALGVSSLLIPPQINDNTFHVPELPKLQSRDHVKLRCAGGCPTFQAESVKTGGLGDWFKTMDNTLEAEVTVIGRAVFFNGQQIWPRTTLPPVLYIQQQGGQVVPISTSFEYKQEISLVNDHEAMKIHPISIEILAVVDQVVQAESVEVHVAESASGVGLTPSAIEPYHSSPLIDSCTNVLCRVRGTIALKYNEWRKAVTNKLRGWSKCGGKAGHNVPGLRFKGGPNKFAQGATLHPHGRHGHHHHRGRFFSFMKHAFKVVVVPILSGFAIGTIISHILKAVIPRIQRLRASRRGEYVEVKQSDAEEGQASIDGPPRYEEVYGEEQKENEDEKK